MEPYRHHVFFCINQKVQDKPCCYRQQGQALFEYAKQRVRDLGLREQGVRVSHSGCLGRCRLGPSVVVYPDNVWYSPQSEQDVELLIQQHLVAGHIADDIVMKDK